MFKTLGILSIIAAVVFAGYVGVLFAIPQYKFYTFQSDVQDIVRFRIRNKDIKKKLQEAIKAANIPVEEGDLNVSFEEGVTVQIFWEETVDVLGKYQKTYEFEVFAED